jgi:hypothetical protein
MDEFWAALVSAAALAVFGEALKAGLGKWFRLLFPNRVDRCPRCGRENLVRALSSGELRRLGLLSLVFSLTFTASLLLSVATVLMFLAVVFMDGAGTGAAIGVAVALAVSTLIARLVVRPVAALRARPPVSCQDCGYRWTAPR